MIQRLICLTLIAVLSLLLCRNDSARRGVALPEDYRGWKKPVKEILDYEVPGHGAGYRIIYANDIAFNPVVKKEKDAVSSVVMRDGAIIVKEIYEKRGDIDKKSDKPAWKNLAVMYKSSRHPDARDGWLYYMKESRMALMQVKGMMCHECHAAANELHPYFDENPRQIFRDFLFVPFAK